MSLNKKLEPMFDQLERDLLNAAGLTGQSMPGVSGAFSSLAQSVRNIRTFAEHQANEEILRGVSPVCRALNAMRGHQGLQPLDYSAPALSLDMTVGVATSVGRELIRPYIETFHAFLAQGGVFNFTGYNHLGLHFDEKSKQLYLLREVSNGAMNERICVRMKISLDGVSYDLIPLWELGEPISISRDKIPTDLVVNSVLKPTLAIHNLELLQPVAYNTVENLFFDVFTEEEVATLVRRSEVFCFVVADANGQDEHHLRIELRNLSYYAAGARLVTFRRHGRMDIFTPVMSASMSHEVTWEDISWPLQREIFNWLRGELFTCKKKVFENDATE